jgi:hypothetical protein
MRIIVPIKTIKMINKLLVVGIVFIFYGCASTDSRVGRKVDSKENAKQNTSIIAVFPLGENEKDIFKDAKENADLTITDLKQIDSVLHTCIADYNAKQEQNSDLRFKKDKSVYWIDLKNYKRQYIAVINRKGEKEVWINCFCDSFNDPNWKTYIINVDDGGNCFFNLKINLTAGNYYDLFVNGDA